MKKTNKKILLSVVSFATISCCALAVNHLNYQTARAEDNTQMQIDALGNLSWQPVVNATGYSVSYTVDGEVYTISSENNTANVGVALTRVAKATVANNNADTDTANDIPASVQFTVTAQGLSQTPMVYTHTFTRYIDYGYATHDFASIKAQAAGETRLSELSLDGSMANWISSAMFKNDVLTIGMRADENLNDSGMTFALFGAYTATASAYNYRIVQKMDGSVVLYTKTTTNQTVASGTDYNKALAKGEEYYLQIAVLDTYDMTGAVAGETVYYSRSIYDETTDTLQQVGGFEKFNATTAISSLSYKTTPIAMVKNKKQMEVDISGMYLKTDGFDDSTYVFSGAPLYRAKAMPTGIYYDNADATFNWNKVVGATKYEYKIGESEWTETISRKVSVETEISTYKELGYLPFSVRAKDGKQADFNLDLDRFYKTRSKVIDYADACYGTKSTGDRVFPKMTEKLSHSYNSGNVDSGGNGVAGYSYLNTKLDGENYGVHIATKFKMAVEVGHSKSFYNMGIYGPSSGEATSDGVAYNRYFVSLYGDGTAHLANANVEWTESNKDNNRSRKDRYWRLQNITDSFRVGYTYYVTFGVDKVYEYDETTATDVVVAYRVTARIERQTDNGLDREVVGILTYDHEQFNNDTYKISSTPTIRLKASADYSSVYRAMADTNHVLSFKVGEQTVKATKEVDFGSQYDFTDVKLEQNDVPNGYTWDGSWYFLNSTGVQLPFPATGYYGITTSNVLTGGALNVQAKLTPTQYDVTFDTASENDSKYTIESTAELKAPTAIPAGKIFDGWYETSDTSFQNKIVSLAGKTGDLALTARFVNGYKIIVDGVENGVASGTNFTLPTPPSVENKTFTGWEVLNGTDYQEYVGSTSFIPTENMTFRAVYNWTEYTLTYVAQGATHTSASTYTKGETTTLANATKAGYFFAGWYLDSEYSMLVSDTADLVGNQTLYARFIQNTLPLTASTDRSKVAQVLPVPTLPTGVTYSVVVEKGAQRLDVSNNACVFDKAGTYNVVYTITLENGDTHVFTTTYTVNEKYLVNVHYGDGQVVTFEKGANALVSENELPKMPDGYQFGGVYTDSAYLVAFDMNTAIDDDLNLYLKWIPVEQKETTQTNTQAPAQEENGNNVLAGVLGSIGGLLLGGGLCVAYVLLKKKGNGKGE